MYRAASGAIFVRNCVAYSAQVKRCINDGTHVYSIYTGTPQVRGLIDCRWMYRTDSELSSSSYWGQVDSYGGGGFALDLGQTQEEALPLLLDLFNNLWLDRATRAVFIDFTLYNPNINLFCVIK